MQNSFFSFERRGKQYDNQLHSLLAKQTKVECNKLKCIAEHSKHSAERSDYIAE